MMESAGGGRWEAAVGASGKRRPVSAWARRSAADPCYEALTNCCRKAAGEDLLSLEPALAPRRDPDAAQSPLLRQDLRGIEHSGRRSQPQI
jgi:hypothetical protein